jgi:hypothetical protein
MDMKAASASTAVVWVRLDNAMSAGALLGGEGNVALLPTGTSLPGRRSVLWGTNSAGTNMSGQSILWSTYTLAQPNTLRGSNVSTAGILRGSSVLWGTSPSAGIQARQEDRF